jgi:hypothetical protein
MYEYGSVTFRGTNHAFPARSMAIASTLSFVRVEVVALA